MVTALDLCFRGLEFESRCGQEFFIVLILGFRSFQLELANTNEINHGIHLANTLLEQKNMAAVSSGV